MALPAARPVALVTGGHARVGAEIAAQLGEAGYDLVLHGRSERVPEPWLAARLDAAGAQWRSVFADLADAAAVHELVPDAARAIGRPVDLLVNNASWFDASESGMPDVGLLGTFLAVNLTAPVVLAGALASQPREGQRAVVNLLDQRVANPNADQIGYTLSKQALAAATRTLAVALAPRVRVNGVAPGLTLPTDDYDAAQMDRLASMMPLNRLSTPADIGAAVVYLAKAPAVTGQTLFVDGGAALAPFERDFVHLARD